MAKQVSQHRTSNRQRATAAHAPAPTALTTVREETTATVDTHTHKYKQQGQQQRRRQTPTQTQSMDQCIETRRATLRHVKHTGSKASSTHTLQPQEQQDVTQLLHIRGQLTQQCGQPNRSRTLIYQTTRNFAPNMCKELCPQNVQPQGHARAIQTRTALLN